MGKLKDKIINYRLGIVRESIYKKQKEYNALLEYKKEIGKFMGTKTADIQKISAVSKLEMGQNIYRR